MTTYALRPPAQKAIQICGNNYMGLLAVIMQHKDPDFYRGPCGRQIARMAGLDPVYLFRKIVKGTEREGEKYVPTGVCLDPDHNSDDLWNRVNTD